MSVVRRIVQRRPLECLVVRVDRRARGDELPGARDVAGAACAAEPRAAALAGRNERRPLLVARAGVRVDRTDFAAAKADLDEAIELMAPTAEPAAAGGRARYREYPDAFVQRGLAREGLRDWQGALSDNVTRVRVRVRLASPSPSPGPDPKPLP